MLNESPEKARYSARWLTQVVLRNHIEVQALAIRRLADPGTDSRVVSLGRILREIGERSNVLGDQLAREAREDLAALGESAEAVKTFADKYVAHLDHDHGTAVPEVTMKDMDETIDFIGKLWERWYVRVTGTVAPNEPPLAAEWWNVLRLQRILQPWEQALRDAQTVMSSDNPSEAPKPRRWWERLMFWRRTG